MMFDIGPGGVGTLVCEVPPLQGFVFYRCMVDVAILYWLKAVNFTA